jgi:DNA-binding response OmpR family regulator
MDDARILIVEDDAQLRTLVRDRLEEEGLRVEAVETGEAALEAVERVVPEVVVLDLMLPGIDGLEVCRRLRAEHPLLYIIMLTARSDEVDRVVGLEVGADDYVTKPFSLKELVARIRAALRRLRTQHQQDGEDDAEERIEHGPLEIDPMRHEVQLHGDAVHLTVREFDLLTFLARHPDRPFTRKQILKQVWDIEYEGYHRTVDTHVQRLRAKIEADSSDPRFIRTVWGVGYKFQATPDEG